MASSAIKAFQHGSLSFLLGIEVSLYENQAGQDQGHCQKIEKKKFLLKVRSRHFDETVYW